jgi:hypothetical protein
MHKRWRCWIPVCVLAAILTGRPGPSFGQTETDDSGGKPALENLLPPSIAQNLQINAWGWFSYLHNSGDEYKDYWLGDVALGGTESFGDRIAATAEMHFLDEQNENSGCLEQAFVSASVFPSLGTIVTVGKFNANIGVEPRDEWDRFGGTSSLLFGAEPQDLIGVLITQPIGDSGLAIKPFIANDFEGHFNFDKSPAGGAIVEYGPTNALKLALTNWVGPGFRLDPQEDYDDSEYAYENWTGPDIDSSDRNGELYFADGRVTWRAIKGLTLAAEGLLAMQGPSANREAWNGFLFLANYDITDRFRAFARFSYLNDKMWLVTGVTQVAHEISGGLAYEILPGAELRGEVRHDGSNTLRNTDSFSIHLTFAY